MLPRYCTYFDSNYLIKGVAMLRSLRQFAPESPITVLCLDAATLEILQKLDFCNIELLGLGELEKADPELLAVKSSRKQYEYYWTMTPSYIRFMLLREPLGGSVVYLDADQMFFAPPDTLLEELAEADVLIQSHNFSPSQSALVCHGKYNVGVLGARRTDEGIKVISWWRERCLEWCYDYLGGEYQFGDQKYLDLFEKLSPGVHVISDLGVGVAPWNHDAFPITRRGSQVFSGETPVVIYHYHSLKLISESITAPMPQKSFFLSMEILQYIYLPYVLALKAALHEIRSIVPGFAKGLAGNDILVQRDVYILENSALQRAPICFAHAIIELTPQYSAIAPRQEQTANLWEGDFATWEEAEKASIGYGATNILEKAVEAARAVVNGEAVAERDTVLMPQRDYSWPTISGILLGAAKKDGEAHLLDFGGALGSSYRTSQPFLARLSKVRWHIVEQPNFVAAGKKEFATEELRFHETVEKCMAENRVDGLLLGSVLQYLPDPYVFLKRMCALDFEYIIMDRTMFNAAKGDRICVQNVPPSIYEAKYPCRMLDFARVMSLLTRKFEIIDAVSCPSVADTDEYFFKAIIAYRK